MERTISWQTMLVLQEMRDEGQLCDAVVQCEDGVEFKVHRAMLSGCSRYFRALFTYSLQTDQQDRHRVAVPGVSSAMMDLIVDYAYTRKTAVSWDNVEELLPAADQFMVLGMVKDCCTFLQNNLTPENCLGIRRFARDYYCPELEKAAQLYLMVHFVEVADTSEELMELDIEDAVGIFNSEQLNVRNEDVVWEAVVKWIEVRPDDRKQYIVRLMRCIRLGLLDTQYFVEKVKNHPFVQENDECRPVVIETLKFLYDLDIITQQKGEVPTPELARPRVPHEVMFAIGGWSGGNPTDYIETYDTRADRWIRVNETDPEGPRAYHRCVSIGFEIFVIGGFDGVEYFSSCRRFNAVTKEWREMSPMNSRRCYVSVAILDDLIYAMGGYDGQHRQNTAERYDYRTNQWTLIAPMNMQRSDACATAMNGLIYITGGFNGNECMSSAECYNPESNQWSPIANMRSRRSGVSSIAYHGCIYALGGFNGISRLETGERYNPETDTWSPIPNMYNPRSNFAVEMIDDMIFAVGGFNGVTTIYHVECFDERTNEWYEATDMNLFRSALAACVIFGIPNIRDFIHKHRDKLMEEKRQKLLQMQHNQIHVSE